MSIFNSLIQRVLDQRNGAMGNQPGGIQAGPMPVQGQPVMPQPQMAPPLMMNNGQPQGPAQGAHMMPGQVPLMGQPGAPRNFAMPMQPGMRMPMNQPGMRQPMQMQNFMRQRLGMAY